jgi:predicted TIM-barrel fold metal-dependent hydrolase
LMTRNGLHSAVLYPHNSLFGNSHLSSAAEVDPQLGLDLVRAYNDFLIDYCSADPNRYIPVMGVPFWDLEASIAEIKRAGEAGHRGIIMTQQPELYGCPSLGDSYWDKLWATAQEMQLPINFHIGSGATENKLLPPSAGIRANAASHPALQFLGNARAIAPMIGGGVCHRFPDLKIVSVESGVGWVPFLLQALDVMWKESDVVSEHPEYDLLPCEYFKRQMYACFWFEHGDSLDTAISYIGADHILYETDFPHPAGMNPGPASHMMTATDFITQNLSYLSDDTLRLLLHDNSAALYHVD